MSDQLTSAESPLCPECGGIGYYQTEGPGVGGVVMMNCHVCGDGEVLNAHGYPISLHHGHYGCSDIGDLGPCDCLCHREER